MGNGMRACGLCSCLPGWILAATLFLGICGFNREGWSQERQGRMVSRQAPPFHVQGIFGDSYSIEAFKGHILVIQFGASW